MFEILSVCNGGGYKYCRTEPPHPKRNRMGLYPLHRVLMENKLGRLLEKREVVHHIDEDKTNDSIENLEVLLNKDHARHHSLKVELLTLNCFNCGKGLKLKPCQYRLKVKRSTKPCCSRRCSTLLHSKIKRSLVRTQVPLL